MKLRSTGTEPLTRPTAGIANGDTTILTRRRKAVPLVR